MLQPRGLAHPLSTHMSISSSVGTYLQVWILAVRAGGTSDPASSPVPVVEIFQFWGGLTRHWEEPPPHEGWPGPSRHAGSALGHWGARFTGEMSQIVFALSGWVLTVSCVSVTGHSVWTELNCSQSALVPPCLPSLQASRPLQPGRPRSNPWPLSSCCLLQPAPAENIVDENEVHGISDGLGREDEWWRTGQVMLRALYTFTFYPGLAHSSRVPREPRQAGLGMWRT